MYVSGLLVRNFRSLEQANVDFQPGLNVLVGKNNAGKSNIIRALDRVLGEKWPTYREFEQRDFYRQSMEGEPADAFLIALRLGGNDINLELLSGVKRKVAVWSLAQAPNWNDIDFLLNVPDSEEKPFYNTYAELGNRICSSRRVYLFLAVPRQGPRNERTYGLMFTEGTAWFLVPSLANELRDALLTTAYIPAFRDPANELRITQWGWYGRLVRHLYQQRTDEQAEQIKTAQDTQAAVLKEIFDQATTDLRRDLEKVIFSYNLSFQPAANTRDDEHKQITLFIDDGLHTPFYEKGSGIQSALVIALFSLYCKRFHHGSTLLLVEEPEIYLHPQARRAIEARLVEFASGTSPNTGCTRQVILSTHSPEFLRSVTLDRLTLVRKPTQGNASQIKTIKSAVPGGSLPATRIAQIMETRNAEAFFADHVILVEGGEEHIIPPLADLVLAETRWLDMHNVSVARVNGKGQFKTYTDLLDALGIGWTVLTDADFLKDGVDHFPTYLDDTGKAAVGGIRAAWRNLTQPANGRDIKDKVFNKDTRDWVQLYNGVESVVADLTSGNELASERVTEISQLWARLSDRVTRANFAELRASCQAELDLILEQLREHGIFVLQKGELEDCFSEEAMSLATSKDLRAIEVGRKLLDCTKPEEAARWIDYADFVDLLKHVRDQMVPVSKSDNGSAPTGTE